MNQIQRLVRVAFLAVFIVGFASTLFHKSVSAEVGLNIQAVYRAGIIVIIRIE